MSAVADSLDKIKKALQKCRSKTKADHASTLNQITSYLVFLNSSTISADAAGKLCDVFRRRLPTLYAAFPQPALNLASALCRTLYDNKVLKDFTAGKLEPESRWEQVLNAILSGILDVLDAEPSDKSKDAIGTSLYPTLCAILSSAPIAHMSAELRCTGYSVLSESAEAHKANQKRLLQTSLLGGTKLGSMLWRTKDYLVLESILNLFARMIPPSGSSDAGRAKRRAFIRSVFVDSSPDDLGTGEELANLVEHVTTPDWEQTAAKIVDVLAGSNIGFPQPFKVPEIFIGEEPKPSDRVYIDGQGFLANVLVEDDLFDSLSAPYSTVTRIEITNRSLLHHTTIQQSSARVTVTLTSRPIIGRKPAPTQSTPTLAFAIEEDDIQRLRTALNSRGMGEVLVVHSTVKQSVLLSPAALEIDLAGNLIGTQELEQRIENLSQLYQTNEPNDDPSLDPPPEACEQIHCIDPSLLTLVPAHHVVSPAVAASKLAQPATPPSLAARTPASTSCSKQRDATLASSALGDEVPTPPVSVPVTPARRTTSQILRDKAFGTSDDDLSEVEHLSPPKVPRKSVKSVLPVSLDKPSTARTKGRTVLDSDDELPVSTPSRPPPKKVVVISDDEIEEVVSSNKPVISRRRSVLAMTVVTPSSTSLRRSGHSKAHCSRTKLVAATTLEDSSDETVLLDSPTKPAPEARAAAQTTATNKKTLAQPTRMKPQDLNQGHISSPPVQPLKKAIKAALRKKDQPLDTSPGEPLASKGTKRKKAFDDPEGAAPTKRAKSDAPVVGTTRASVEKVEVPVFEPDLASSGRAKRHYGGRKKRVSSPPHLVAPAKAVVDYDIIPGSVSSVAKSTKPKPKSKAKPLAKALAKLVDKKPGVEAQVAKKTTRATITKSHRSNKKADNNDKSKPTPRKTGAKTTMEVEQQQSFDEDFFRNLDVGEGPAKPLEEDEADTPEERVAPISNTHRQEQHEYFVGTTNTGTRQLLEPAKDTTNSKKSNKAPWNDVDVRKLEKTDLISSTIVDEVIQGTPHNRVVPEFSDITDDIMVRVVDDDTLLSLDAKSAPVERANIQSPQRATDTPQKPHGEAVTDIPVHTPLETLQSVQEFVRCSPIRDGPMAARKTAVEPAASQLVESNVMKLADPKVPIRASAKTKAASPPIFPAFHKHLESTPKNQTKRTRFEYPERRVEKQLSTSPAMEELASVLQQIQQAILNKITNRVEGVRHEVRKGRELILEEAAADLAAMREDSVDRYNYLIELEADYASFGRELTHALDDLCASNQNIKSDVEKIIQAHDRGSIVKHVPNSLFPSKLPASIQRFSS